MSIEEKISETLDEIIKKGDKEKSSEKRRFYNETLRNIGFIIDNLKMQCCWLSRISTDADEVALTGLYESFKYLAKETNDEIQVLQGCKKKLEMILKSYELF